ncbi:nucleotidyltransferase domain-containing protein [Streptomyces clavuligerus]|uniref:nucleotidyltransferase domain-containing protein n=1 Tax=Streptomyces clavuligerus TaxID=1901 RepID=UPI0001851FC5|nr:nucleotidyltransferase domain-containing protein [Streptomyces clavuligerus]WDN55880.1 nucleotidyltransferase domain-containing protein [Streptomyces clavuligerus]
MKRTRATELVEGMLHRLDGSQDWPLHLVRQVWLFGSFARGAIEPHDVDVAVRFERDERMNEAVVQAIFSGGNPYAPLRRALAGSSRGLQFQFDNATREQLEAEGAFMLPLWRQGDTLAEALGVLHAIAEDPAAGRAERHDMIDAFEGIDRHIPRPVRADLIGWQRQRVITISRITLPDAPHDTSLLATPDMRWAFHRWNEDSPLRRAALAGLTLVQGLGADLDDVELAGQRLPTPRRLTGHRSEPRWWVNWKWQNYRSIPYCVTGADGWLEVVQPTRTRPLTALVIKPGPKAAAFPR